MKTVTFDETKFVLVPMEPTEAMIEEVSKVMLARIMSKRDGRGIKFGIIENWQTMIQAAPAPSAAVDKRVGRQCLWERENDPDMSWWNTSCGQAWSFTTDGPKENGMNFCHYCGKPLRLNPELTNG